MRAIDAARKPPVTASCDSTVAQVAQLMDDQVVGAVVVTDRARPVGIVTDRDLAIRAVARGIPGDGRVDSVMSTDLVTLEASADARDAVAIFGSHPFRRLPLVEGDRMVGMLTVDDLVMNEANDLGTLLRAVTGQVIFGHPEPAVPAAQA